MSSVDVRSLGPEEIAPAVGLILSMMEEMGSVLPADAYIRLLSELLHDLLEGSAVLYMAWAHGEQGYQPAGVVEVKIINDLACQRLECFRLYVVPEFRSRGVARKLLKAATSILPEDQDALIAITTRGPLPRSYERLGFTPLIQTHTARLSDIRKRMK